MLSLDSLLFVKYFFMICLALYVCMEGSGEGVCACVWVCGGQGEIWGYGEMFPHIKANKDIFTVVERVSTHLQCGFIWKVTIFTQLSQSLCAMKPASSDLQLTLIPKLFQRDICDSVPCFVCARYSAVKGIAQ